MTNEITLTDDYKDQIDAIGNDDAPEVEHYAVKENGLYVGAWGLHDDSELAVALLTNDFDPAQITTDTTYDDIKHHEPDSPAYEAGGKPIENVRMDTEPSPAGTVHTIHGDSVCWKVHDELQASYAAVYDRGSLNELVTIIDFGLPQAATGPEIGDEPADFAIEWHDDGILNLTIP